VNGTALMRAARVAAVAIAVAAAIDPPVTVTRAERPVVAVAATGARDSMLARRVAGALAKRFTVVAAPLPGADASVIVGSRMPDDISDVARPTFAVLGARAGASVTISDVRAPRSTPADARVPVTAVVQTTAARGRTLDVALHAGGMAVDRVTRTVAADDETLAVPLSFTPASAGPAPLRVVATMPGGDAAAVDAVDIVVDVQSARRTVLFSDPRPSWMSTFARRAAERDPRLVVTSRVVTSRGVSTDAGSPPARLDDPAALAPYDAVVIGAPEELSAADVVGLEAYMRRRGGSVVFLLDRRAPGPYERLTGAGAWAADTTGKPEPILLAGADSETMRAAELAWPARLPSGAEPMATAGARPIVWSTPAGAGRLIVSGALDAWRFRDPPRSSFDRFWQTVIARAAGASPPPVALNVARQTLRPGERATATVTVRDAALSSTRPVRASAGATLVSARGSTPVRLWPGERAGTFVADFRAPRAAGLYRLVTTANGARGEAPIVVGAGSAHATPDETMLLRAWAAATGGRAIDATDAGSLASSIAAVVRPAERPVVVHPMRSAWWIVPFALALSAEWLTRRRRGLA